MVNDKELKNIVLDSIDDSLIKDNSKSIKQIYLSNSNNVIKKKKVNWGAILGTSFTAVAAAGVAVAVILKGNEPLIPTSTQIECTSVPETMKSGIANLSFGVSSATNVLVNAVGEQQSKAAESIVKSRPGEGGPQGGDPYGPHGPDQEDEQEEDNEYLVPVNKMYDLAKPYLTTVDSLLNGDNSIYQIEESGDEEYPFKLGNFIFKIVEDTEQEGEVEEEPSEEEEETPVEEPTEENPSEEGDPIEEGDPEEEPVEEVDPSEMVRSRPHREDEGQPGGDPWGDPHGEGDPWGEPEEYGEPEEEPEVEEPVEEEPTEEEPEVEEPVEEPTEEEPEEPEQPEEGEDEEENDPWGDFNFSFISEYYLIEGLLTIDEVTYPVNGEHVTYGLEFGSSKEEYSELYLNVLYSDTNELTVYKSSYSEQYSNTFKDNTYSYGYVEETYGYIESEISIEEGRHGEEKEVRKVVNAVTIDTVSEESTYNEESKSKSKVYLSLESSYVDEDEVENKIEADLTFRLPTEEGGHQEGGHGYRWHRDELVEEPEEPVEEPEEEVEPEVEEPVEEPVEEEPEVEEPVEEPVEEEPTEEEPEVEEPEEEVEPTKAFRVDYDLRVTKDQKYEREDDFGHGQHSHGHEGGYDRGGYRYGPYQPGKEVVNIYGSFYMYKDGDGNLIDPDFEVDGKHTVSSSGFGWDWYNNWDW